MTRILPRWRSAHQAQLAAVVALTLCATAAHAYTYGNTCQGSPDRDDRTSLAEFRMRCSFPDGDQANRFAQVVANWNAASNFPVTGYDITDDCTFRDSNWHNEVGMVYRSSIDGGANGITRYFHGNLCSEPYHVGNYSEADVRIANDLDPYTNYPASQAFSNNLSAGSNGNPLGGYVYAVLAHEMGHQLGIGHENHRFSIMSGLGVAAIPGSTEGPMPYPDDALGVSGLYGFNYAKNLVPSGQHWDGLMGDKFAVVDNLQSNGFKPCVNTSLNATVTVLNMGQTATYSHQVWLAKNPDGSSPVVTYTWSGVTTQILDYSQFYFNLSLAGITPGTYYLAHRVDSANQIAENNENDNLLVYATPVVVTDCNNALTWHTSSGPELL